MQIASIPSGTGYWNLSNHPWGGEFHRLTEDSILRIETILSHYKDGSICRFTVRINNDLCGFSSGSGVSIR